MTSRRIRRSKDDLIIDAVIYTIGFVMLFMVLYPLYFMLIASFSNPDRIAVGEVFFLPKDVTLKGYQRIFDDARVWTGYKNTIFYTVAGTMINLVCTIPAAYALSRKDLYIRNVVMMYFVITMFFSGGLVPTYLTIKSLKMDNTFWVMIIPFCVSVYNLIIARTFFQSSIPQELLDAARIDGCTNFKFFTHIVLQLSKAILGVIGLYYAVGHWSEFFRALIYIRKKELVPLQIVLRDILVKNEAFNSFADVGSTEQQNYAEQIKYGIIIVSTAPIIAVYPFVQKYFTKGVMIDSLKG